MGRTFIDLAGKKYGRFTALYLYDRVNGKIRWFCKCDCGNVRFVYANNLTRPNCMISCGCYRKTMMVTHGESLKTPEYSTWLYMVSRCTNKSNTNYKWYGGRGITVCDRWQGKNGYLNFIADMGRKPTSKHSIDRINNDGNYESSNCKWATKLEQMKNRSDNVWIEYDGRKMIMADWARELKANYKLFCQQVKRFPLEMVFRRYDPKNKLTRINQKYQNAS